MAPQKVFSLRALGRSTSHLLMQTDLRCLLAQYPIFNSQFAGIRLLHPLRACSSKVAIPVALAGGYLFNSRRNHMANSNSNSGKGSSGSSSGGQQGSNSGSKNENSKGGNSSGSKESQQDQSSSKQNSPGSKSGPQGGTHDQHVKAGQQNHKND